ncbi:MAG TPA: AarF/UbiB family protein [Thermomicrobiales bacterium]|nr:AarF/UbiB family protein [Thermomicrobiales bacterium]
MLQAINLQRRHAARYRQIVRTLVRYGLGGVVGPVDVGGWVRQHVPGLGRIGDRGHDALRRGRPANLRAALEELGPTFVKLGQILSTRADLLPPAYIAELERLQDRVPSDDPASIVATIEAELGSPIYQIFKEFDLTPLAAASIGQVHAAVLPDGSRVVVKVQRAGIEPSIIEDLDILADLALLGESHSALLRQADVVALVKEFSWTLRSELDYRREAANIERFRNALERDPRIRVPMVHPRFSSRRVLTLERMDGIRIDRFAGQEDASESSIANRLVAMTTRLLLSSGIFHADPHPGNFAIAPDGALVLYDFGMVGTIDERLRERLLLLALAVSERDASRIVDEVALLGALPAGWDRQAMERDVSLLTAQYIGTSLSDLPLAMVVSDIMNLVRRHGVRMPSELALLAKTVSMLEALSRRLDPDIDVIAVVDPIIRESIRQFWSPAFWVRRYKLRPLDAMMLGVSLPGQVQRLFARIDRNDLTFHIHIDDLPETMRIANSMVNRLAFAIMIAAAWLGMIVLFLGVDPDITGFPGVLFLVGFLLLGALVAYGLYASWRSSR